MSSNKSRISSSSLIVCLSVIACGSNVNPSDAGDAAPASGGQGCDRFCPLESATLVVTAPGEGAVTSEVTGVQATVVDPSQDTLACVITDTATFCNWPPDSITPGDYSIVVTAPGYEPATISASLTIGSGPCPCVSATLDPSSVTLKAVPVLQ